MKDLFPNIFLETVLNPNVISVNPAFRHLVTIYDLVQSEWENSEAILLCLKNNINVLRMVSKSLNLPLFNQDMESIVHEIAQTFFEAYQDLSSGSINSEYQDKVVQASQMLRDGVSLVYCAFVDDEEISRLKNPFYNYAQNDYETNLGSMRT